MPYRVPLEKSNKNVSIYCKFAGLLLRVKFKVMFKKYLVNIYNKGYEIVRRARFDCQYRFKVLTAQQTIKHIQQTGCSIVRYGDGEFGLITKTNNPDFQKNDEALAQRLAEICKTNDPRVMICIPHNFKTTKDCNEFARKFWEWWIWENDNLEHVAHLLGLNPWHTKVYGDAQITRPYMDWKDKSQTPQRFADLKSLWENRDVLIVEGEQTRLGTGNDLLENTHSVQRLVCPANDAFSRYEEILSAAKHYGQDKLVLLALGPTATVLAYDLAMSGIQALDIGHIDIEYEWFLSGATEKVAVAGKAVQELHQDIVETPENKKYLSQIVERIQ